MPFGEPRWEAEDMPGERGYTGQRREGGFALLDYNARYYSAYLGRFVSPVSIIPDAGNSMDWDRYQYAWSNPVRYNDPSGHWTCGDWYDPGCEEIGDTESTPKTVIENFAENDNYFGDIDYWVATHPQYDPSTDTELSDFQRLTVSYAQMRVGIGSDVSNSSVVWLAAGFGVPDPSIRPKVVIGESMSRVKDHVAKIGAEVYPGLPGYEDLKKILPPEELDKLAIEHNRAWIRKMMELGAEIHDIGPNFERRLNEGIISTGYVMERRETKHYPLVKDFIRKGNSSTITIK